MAQVRTSLDGGQIGFPVYLLFACIANGVFLYKSTQDVSEAAPGSISQAGSQLMLGAAISELIWVAPCFFQCAIYIFVVSDNQTGSAACDFQGFYSLVSSISSMLMAPVLSWFTLVCLINGSSKPIGRVRWLCVACIAAPTVLCLLPVLPGFREHAGYASLGEGFCYWDLSTDIAAAFTLVLTMLLISITLVLNVQAIFHLQRDSVATTAKRGTLLALMLSYVLTWILWPVASVLTLSGQGFPQGMMIAGGALGHAQALVNPVLYGVFWRRYLLTADAVGACAKVHDAAATETAQGA